MFFQSDIFANLLFFFAFFLAFSLIELILIYALNRFAAGHWKFVIDTVIRFQVHHRGAIRWFAYASILLVLLAIVFITPLFDILTAAPRNIQWFSLGLLVVMVLIYFFMTRKVTRLAIEKRIHQYLYIVISLFFYTLIVVLSNEMYGVYRHFVATRIVNPTINRVGQAVDQNEANRLLDQFRQQAKAGGCTPVDYQEKQKGGLLQFDFVSLDTDFIAPDYADGQDLSFDFSGRECTDGENTFLLKKDGSWYWVTTSENL